MGLERFRSRVQKGPWPAELRSLRTCSSLMVLLSLCIVLMSQSGILVRGEALARIPSAERAPTNLTPEQDDRGIGESFWSWQKKVFDNEMFYMWWRPSRPTSIPPQSNSLSPEEALIAQTRELEFAMAFNGEGWFGFGIGSWVMWNTDFYIAYLDQSTQAMTVGDWYMDELSNFLPDNQRLDGSNDVRNISFSSQGGPIFDPDFAQAKTVVTFTRLMKTGDQWDVALSNKTLPVIWAYSSISQTLSYHGRWSRGLSRFQPLADTLVDKSSTLNYMLTQGRHVGEFTHTQQFQLLFHAFTMIFLFGFIYPIALFIALFPRSLSASGETADRGGFAWVDLHERAMSHVATEAFVFILFNIVASVGTWGSGRLASSSTHLRLAMSIGTLVACQFVLGYSLKWLVIKKYRNLYRLAHAFIGCATTVCVSAGVLTGLDMLFYGSESYQTMQILAGSYFAFVILSYYFLGYKGYIRPFLSWTHKHLLHRLPAIFLPPDQVKVLTWDEIRASALTKTSENGRSPKYIVIECSVYDVSGYFEAHPGGEEILKQFVGKDATSASYGSSPLPERTPEGRDRSRSSFSWGGGGGSQHTHGDFARHVLQSLKAGVLPRGKRSSLDAGKDFHIEGGRRGKDVELSGSSFNKVSAGKESQKEQKGDSKSPSKFTLIRGVSRINSINSLVTPVVEQEVVKDSKDNGNERKGVLDESEQGSVAIEKENGIVNTPKQEELVSEASAIPELKFS